VSLVTFILICGPTALCFRNFLFTQILFIIAFIDYNKGIIPNVAVLAGVIVWAAFLPFTGDGIRDGLISSLAGAAVLLVLLLAVTLVTEKVMKREVLGGGDIKIIAVTGLYLGVKAGLINLVLICIAGLIYFAVSRRNKFALGPSVAVATYVSLLIGKQVADYLGYLI